MTTQIEKYRISLSAKDISTIMTALDHYISHKGEGTDQYAVIARQKLSLVSIKIASGMLKPEFVQSAQSAAKQTEFFRKSELLKKIQDKTATAEEIAEYNNLEFGIFLQ